MARKHPPSTPPALKVIAFETRRSPSPQPPPGLGVEGTAFWNGVMASYEFSDPASTETLRQACLSLDLAADCRRQIEKDGLMLRPRGGVMRDNPLIKHELTARSLAIRTLARLGLDLEAVRQTSGRPPGAIGG